VESKGLNEEDKSKLTSRLEESTKACIEAQAFKPSVCKPIIMSTCAASRFSKSCGDAELRFGVWTQDMSDWVWRQQGAWLRHGGKRDGKLPDFCQHLMYIACMHQFVGQPKDNVEAWYVVSGQRLDWPRATMKDVAYAVRGLACMIYETTWIRLEHREALDDLVLQAALSIISYCNKQCIANQYDMMQYQECINKQCTNKWCINKQYKECITLAAWACLIFRGESAHDVIQNEAKRWDIINMVQEHIDKDAAQGIYADRDVDMTTPT
jgi:hypothetical protein